MGTPSEIIRNWAINVEIPKDVTCLLSSLREADTGLFFPQESSHFDYKKDFPFSKTDNYFFAIVRLVAAFHNTFGGLVVFGVHDEHRDGGHNPVNINVEKFNTRLREVFDVSIECQHRAVFENDKKLIDLLLVPKRKPDQVPVVLQQTFGKYRKGTLWFRRGHEVLEASSRELSFLFGPRHEIGSPEESDETPVYAALPSNPATIKQFVGRIEVLRGLFH